MAILGAATTSLVKVTVAFGPNKRIVAVLVPLFNCSEKKSVAYMWWHACSCTPLWITTLAMPHR